MSTMSRAEYKSAILAAAESGALKEALEYWKLSRMAISFERESKYNPTRTFGIVGDDYHDLMGVYGRLGITPPVKFRYSESRRKYTRTVGCGYDWVDMEFLGGDGSGEVRSAFEDSGLRFSF